MAAGGNYGEGSKPPRGLRNHDCVSPRLLLLHVRPDLVLAAGGTRLLLPAFRPVRRRRLRRPERVPRDAGLHRGDDGRVPRRVRVPIGLPPARLAPVVLVLRGAEGRGVRSLVRDRGPRVRQARPATDRAHVGDGPQDAPLPQVRGEGRHRGPQVLVVPGLPAANRVASSDLLHPSEDRLVDQALVEERIDRLLERVLRYASRRRGLEDPFPRRPLAVRVQGRNDFEDLAFRFIRLAARFHLGRPRGVDSAEAASGWYWPAYTWKVPVGSETRARHIGCPSVPTFSTSVMTPTTKTRFTLAPRGVTMYDGGRSPVPSVSRFASLYSEAKSRQATSRITRIPPGPRASPAPPPARRP